jgi:hypothetical protein
MEVVYISAFRVGTFRNEMLQYIPLFVNSLHDMYFFNFLCWFNSLLTPSTVLQCRQRFREIYLFIIISII